jgi:hypothetical protein
MAQQINDNFSIKAPKLLDDRSHKIAGGVAVPYTSINEALSTVSSSYRSIGLIMLINDGTGIKEYWYKNGIGDSQLELKKPDTINNIDQVPTPGHLDWVLSSDGAYTFLQQKVDKLEGKGLSANDFTDGDKSTVGGAALHLVNTNNPHNVTKSQIGLSNVPNADTTNPANILQDSTHRFVSDTQIATWNTSSGSVQVDQIPTQGNTTHVISSAGAYTALQAKVDKISGKGLSTNDYDNSAKTKVDLIDQVYSLTEKNKLSAITGTNTGDETTSRINTLYGYTPANAATLSSHISNTSNPHSTTKAQVGLGNVPNLDATNPVNIAQDSTHRFVTDSQISTWNSGTGGGGSLIDDTTIATTTTYSSSKVVGLLGNKVDTTTTINGKAISTGITLVKADIGLGNVVNLDTSNPSNITQSASFRFVTDTEKTTWNSKQAALVAGTNIKTLNGVSPLGSGDIAIATINDTTTSSSSVFSSSKVSNLLDGKANTLHSHAATDIVTDSSHRFVTDSQISTWNSGTGGGTSLLNDTTPSTTTTYSSSKIETVVGGKVSTTTTVNGKALSSNITLTNTDVGLSNVVNVNTSTTTNITEGTNLYYTSARVASDAPVKSVAGKTGVITLAKGDVGLGNVVNIDTTNPVNITQDSGHRFVTDSQISTWNNGSGGATSSDYWLSAKLTGGAVGDGSADDSAALSSIFTSNRIVYLPSGTYKAGSTINMSGISNLRVLGSKSSKITSPNVKTLISMTNCTNVEFVDIIFESTLNDVGSAADTTNGLIKVFGGNNIRIVNNTFQAQNSITDGIRLSVDSTHTIGEMLIQGNRFNGMGQRGIEATTSSFAGQYFQDVTIDNNLFYNTGTRIAASGQAIFLKVFGGRVDITENIIRDANGSGIEIDGILDMNITNNTLSSISRAFSPFNIQGNVSSKTLTGLVMTNNNVNVQGSESNLIVINDVSGFSISSNNFKCGVVQFQGIKGQFTGNNFLSDDTRAFYIQNGSSDNYFAGNVFDDSANSSALEPINSDTSGVTNNVFCNNPYRTQSGNGPYSNLSTVNPANNVFTNQF